MQRANGRYAQIARESMLENQPETYSRMKADGTLEPYLLNLDRTAIESASNLHRQYLAAGFQPGEAMMRADTETIRDQLLHPSESEVRARNRTNSTTDPASRAQRVIRRVVDRVTGEVLARVEEVRLLHRLERDLRLLEEIRRERGRRALLGAVRDERDAGCERVGGQGRN